MIILVYIAKSLFKPNTKSKNHTNKYVSVASQPFKTFIGKNITIYNLKNTN